jgi:hypothetical protein
MAKPLMHLEGVLLTAPYSAINGRLPVALPHPSSVPCGGLSVLFTPTKYRMVKIVHSSFEVVL